MIALLRLMTGMAAAEHPVNRDAPERDEHRHREGEHRELIVAQAERIAPDG